MKNDKKIEKLVGEINAKTTNWLGIVGSANQDAYTDRLLESIIEDTKQLAVLYKGNFKEDK